MKPHLPLLLLTALLATAPVKAVDSNPDFIFYLPSDNPAHNIAYIRNGTKVIDSKALAVIFPAFFVSGAPYDTKDDAFEFPIVLKDFRLYITSTAIFTNRELAASGDYINISCALTATQGSILLKTSDLRIQN